MIEHPLFEACLKKFGAEHEKKITIGEIGEFLTLEGREAQGRATDEDWIDEIADVLISMTQMGYIYGIDKVKARIKIKMDKKMKHLEEDVHNPN